MKEGGGLRAAGGGRVFRDGAQGLQPLRGAPGAEAPGLQSANARAATRISACIAAVVLAAVVTPVAQSVGAAQTPLRIGIDLVTVDVSVLDGNRKPVRGLTVDDFVVFEDGKPRPIVAFSMVDVPAADSATAPDDTTLRAPWTRDAPRDVVANDLPAEGRLVVVVLDRSIPAGAPVQAAREIAMAVVDELGPGDVAAVVRSSGFANDGRVQGFTADRRLLAAAVESTFIGGTSIELNPSPIPGQDSKSGECPCGRCVFETLANVAEAMAEAPRRRKVVLFVGSSIVMPDGVATDPCYSATLPHRDRLMRQLEMANVTVHAIDPSGVIATSPRASFVIPQNQVSTQAVQPPGGFAQADARRLDHLRVLPDATGGRLVTRTNTPGEFLPAIFDESRSYYLLGFEPAAEPDGATHRIEVRVNRRDTTVRARNGYVMEPREAAGGPASAMSDLVTALRAQQPRQQLPLTMSVVPFPAAADSPTPVAVLVGTAAPRQDGPHRFTMAAGAFDLSGEPVVVYMQTIETSGTAPPDVLDGFVTRLNLAPGRYEIRAAVRDERTRAVGSVFSFLDVPDARAHPIALSGLIFRREPSATPPAGGALDGLTPFVPTTMRRFGPTDDVSVFARVQQSGAAGPAVVRAVVVDAAGKTRFEQSATIDASRFNNGSTPYSLALPLAGLPSGDYLLRIEATTGQGRAQREARFAVWP